ncbi:MAG: elongation factor Ts [Rhodospirillaceae bacterium]|jgi:elongation factor Ts|nr:elongation factor Ts [Rhodospirillaceae bacterium]|tara:strand:+ start:269 stop:1195 length:927 start_codon:yes stop_codon:yes gene_type:complete
MVEITAALVKKLRDETGAGMMDCKKALVETDADHEAAVDWLRAKGLAAAAKKAGRVASEGLVGVSIDGAAGALVEVNAETDFVARNEEFQEFVKTTAGLGLESGGDLDALKAAAYPGTERTVEEQLTHLMATIGENMSLRRIQVIEVGQGVMASYVHNSLASGLGRIGVLTALESEADATTLEALGKQISMHVAAVKPLAVSRGGLDPAAVERERGILAQQARETGKPEEIIEKMVEGRMRKYFEEVCLLDQTFVIDGETKVEIVLEEASKESGAAISVSAFGLFVLGEGIEKKKENLAAEVAAAIGT